ncbi:deoxyribodipyrimidine photo-lyase [Acinetobacter sp. ANC 4648]|uniref:deoxyribodipyrimidine photo-lyase n=1 Tax=Acinetobacter sp. ANC 4648 TaxID=1977875 RepID=UPI000A3472A2|nr:deoxyribodipyrimidine photo-lyase [Acinetobacter sp. ANC 4648]OTG81637.1 deoxyribodipyrimidine photo-lyase [Acinetobacter sp. ANC 4648]
MQLIWFRQDLRIHDHAALWHATTAGQSIALVILSPEQWQQHDDAPIKIDFYLRQLKQLKQELDLLNIPLIIETIQLWNDAPQFIQKLCIDLNVFEVHANIELGQNELKRDLKVQQLLHQNEQDLQLYHDRTLFPVGSLHNKSNQPYQVFSAFKKQCYERLSISIPQCFPKPETQKPLLIKLTSANIPSLEELYNASITQSQRDLWPASEIHAFHQLDNFINHKVSDYQKERDFPNIDGTSQLSAYLNIGTLSIRQCIQALFRHQQGQFHIDNEGQQTWLDELLWREFYQHILFEFPKVSKHLPFKDNTQTIIWRHAPDDLIAWQHGKTGIPIVDAGMRQLITTGWMHNRVRMIVAMFLCKNLLIDWRLGERWFMQHLIDGDLAANNGGWQWCASTGTDSVPYFRVFNPISQSQKFDTQGDYIRKWLPELAHLDAKSIHEPYAKNPDLELDYPQPIVDLKQSRLRAIAAFKAG